MYATIEDLISEFGEKEIIEISSLPNVDVLNEDKCYRCLEQATAEIDSYIGMKVAVPLINYIPNVIKRICQNLARYRLYDDKKPENVIKTYEAELNFLKDFRDGRVFISFIDPATINENGETVITAQQDESKIKVANFESSVFSKLF